MAKQAFIKLKKFLCCWDINFNLKIRMLRCYFFSTLLYDLETWTLKQVNLKQHQGF